MKTIANEQLELVTGGRKQSPATDTVLGAHHEVQVGSVGSPSLVSTSKPSTDLVLGAQKTPVKPLVEFHRVQPNRGGAASIGFGPH
jgi:hypothetical protein